MSQPTISPVADQASNTNFQAIVKSFTELSNFAVAKELEFTVVAGDNFILPTVPKPRGRIITYQTAASSFFDKGLDSFGRWILNSSAPCIIRISFF